MTQKMTIPDELLMAEISELLAKKCEVTLCAKGRSMSPYIKDGKDKLILQHTDTDALRKGDIILAKTTDGKYVIHRIVGIDNGTITLKGDGNIDGTEECRLQDVLGKLMFIERNGKRIDCNTSGQRIKAMLQRKSWQTAKKIRFHIRAAFCEKSN